MRPFLVGSFVSLLFTGDACIAASVTATSTCTVPPGGTTVVTANGCSATQVDQFNITNSASASAVGSYAIFGNSLSFSSATTATAVGDYPSPLGEASSANGTVAIAGDLATLGPLRTGILEITYAFDILQGAGADRASVSYSVAGFGISCNGGNFSVRCPPVGFGYPITFTTTIELGEILPFSADVEADAHDYLALGQGQAGGTATFQFFEADGTTPVDVYEVPEPPSSFLYGIGIFGLLALYWRRGPLAVNGR